MKPCSEDLFIWFLPDIRRKLGLGDPLPVDFNVVAVQECLSLRYVFGRIARVQKKAKRNKEQKSPEENISFI